MLLHTNKLLAQSGLVVWGGSLSFRRQPLANQYSHNARPLPFHFILQNEISSSTLTRQGLDHERSTTLAEVTINDGTGFPVRKSQLF